MSTPLERAFATATEDVRCALRWLMDNGFELTAFRGGPAASFGDVWLAFVRDGCRVEVTQDRAQWMLAIQPEWAAQPLYFEVVLTAKTGAPTPPSEEPSWTALPQQLPHGVSWCDELPSAVSWLGKPASHSAVAEAERSWDAEMRRRAGPSS